MGCLGGVGVIPHEAVASQIGRCEILEAHFSEKCILKKNPNGVHIERSDANFQLETVDLKN